MRKVYSCKDDFDPTSTTVSNAIKKILSDYSREVKVKVPTEEFKIPPASNDKVPAKNQVQIMATN